VGEWVGGWVGGWVGIQSSGRNHLAKSYSVLYEYGTVNNDSLLDGIYRTVICI